MRTPRQLVDQTVRHQVYVERLKTGNVREFERLMTGLERRVVGQLAGENITAWNQRRLNKQLSAIRGMMNEDLSGPIHDLWRKQVTRLADYEVGFETRSLRQVIKADFDLPSSQQLTSAVFSEPLSVRGPDGGKLLESFFTDWSRSQVNSVTNAVRLGYAQGQTTSQIVREMRRAGGLFDQNRRSLEAVARTSLQHAAVQARQATWQRNSDIVRRRRIVATLDSRTTQQCRSLDGRVFPIDSGPAPPFHVNCRTTEVGVLDERFEMLDEGGTRAARGPDGTVDRIPANETYYSWLKKQPAGFQDSAIGATRGKLLREGGLSAERFAEMQLGKRWEPLNLDQMRELEPLAFKRAGLS